MNTVLALTGSYVLHPGMQPAITGRRPVLSQGLLGRMFFGGDGASVERSLGQLFNLCAHAHQRAARLAIQAAGLSDNTLLQPKQSNVLLLETARDHLRSMALDWPRRLIGLPESPAELGWLRGCPVSLVSPGIEPTESQAGESLVKLMQWLEAGPLQQPIGDWLAQHRQVDALARWCRLHGPSFYPARFLEHGYSTANALTPGTRLLSLLSADIEEQIGNLRSIAQAMVDDPKFVQYPNWHGACAETGPWARLRHDPSTNAAQTCWSRLSARWIELLEIVRFGSEPISLADPPLLSCGALALGGHQAIAWCEMARGLLLHWLRLDDHGRVQDYQVLAPTEWNFHPQGGLAQALSALGSQDTESARALAAAYDACVECSVSTQ